MLKLSLTGRLGGWKDEMQPRMGSFLWVSWALPVAPPFGGVDLSSSQGLAGVSGQEQNTAHYPFTETLAPVRLPVFV